MTVYFVTIGVLLACSALELTVRMSRASRWMLWAIIYGILVVQVGCRWETGTDWNNYFTHFQSITTLSTVAPNFVSPEYGYNLAVWFAKIVTANYSVFLTVHAAIFYFLVCCACYRFTQMVALPMMVFYAVTMGEMGANRQLIALAIGLYGIRYIINKRWGSYLACVLVACLFHYSAIILLVFLACDRPIKSLTIVILIVCAIAIGLSPLPSMVFSGIAGVLGIGEAYKAVEYLEKTTSLSESGLSVLGLIRRVLFLTIFVYSRKRLRGELRFYDVMLNGYLIGVLMYFVFAKSLLVMVSRGSLYFDAFEPLLLASQVLVFRRRSNRLIFSSALCAVSVVLLLESIAAYPDLFIPYKGMGINSDYSRLMY